MIQLKEQKKYWRNKMFENIYQMETRIYGQLDIIYYFYYNLWSEELLDINNRNKADIICECQGSTKETTLYFTQIKEPCGQRFGVISAPLKHFLDDNVKLPPNIKEALMEIRKYIEGE